MESAYSQAARELAEIRRKNIDELRNRENEVRDAFPEYGEVETSLAMGGAALARCVLSGTSDISAIRSHIEQAQAKKAEILAKLGRPADYLDVIYSCSKCRDTGFDEEGMRCECYKNMVSKYVGLNSNLTEVMREERFDKFDFSLFANQPDIKGRSVLKMIETAYKKAEDFAENFEKTKANLYLYGAAGTGKTYISSCIANRVLERGFTVYYQSAFQLLDMIERLKFGRYDENEVQSAEVASKYIYTVDLLIIDDVGTEFVSGYSSAALFDIINARLTSGKSTVISSNLNPVNIEEVYGSRMASRMVGSYHPIPFIGMDLRKLKLNKSNKASL